MTPNKCLCYLLLILLACNTAFAKKEDTEKVLKKQFSYSFNDIQDNLVVVEHTDAVGSGFIAQMGGRYYIFTNQHVILGGDRIRFESVSGKLLKPKKVELSTTRDIARLLIDTDSGLKIANRPKMDSPVGVFGNSDGGGVATELYGKVTSVGSELVEVSAGFVSGNSGSPVLNLDQEVIGIASFVRFSTDQKTKGDDKPKTITQRYCYRLDGLQWKPVNWKKYNEKYGKASLENNALINDIFELIWAWHDQPFDKISTENHADHELQKWSKNHNYMVNRIERMNKKGRATPHQLHNTNKQIRKDLIDSAEAFSKVCQHRARQMRFLSDQRELTGYLREEFLRLVERLGNASKVLDDVEEEFKTFNYFSFKSPDED